MLCFFVWQIRGSPTLSKDGKVLYVGSDDKKVHAIDAATGKKKWTSYETGGPVSQGGG